MSDTVYTTPQRLLEEAAIEAQDDDYFDVDSEDDDTDEAYNIHDYTQDARRAYNNPNTLMRIGSLRSREHLQESYAISQALDTYRPERVANPLKNEMTARVFAHFVRVTAPTIALFDRRPKGQRSPVSGPPLSFSEQGLWTHAMPMAALHHQGLLHAILAISSLHIARLTHASSTPSYKHYAYALKRIHNAICQPTTKHSVPLLAASLLLAVYELWCAEHVKWSSHLTGAAQLLAEINFAPTYREFRRIKVEETRRMQYHAVGHGLPGSSTPNNDLWNQLVQVPDIDDRLVSVFSGKFVRYDNHGHISGDQPTSRIQPLDIPKFEIQKDLFWWYCRQDMVQSCVSGNSLL